MRDVDLRLGVVTVRRALSENDSVAPKSGQERVVPLWPRLADVLTEALRGKLPAVRELVGHAKLHTTQRPTSSAASWTATSARWLRLPPWSRRTWESRCWCSRSCCSALKVAALGGEPEACRSHHAAFSRPPDESFAGRAIRRRSRCRGATWTPQDRLRPRHRVHCDRACCSARDHDAALKDGPIDGLVVEDCSRRPSSRWRLQRLAKPTAPVGVDQGRLCFPLSRGGQIRQSPLTRAPAHARSA